MTTNEILATVRKKILEETEDVIEDSQLLIYGNNAYDDLKIRTFSNDQIETATVTFTSGTGTLPANFGTLYGDAYDASENRFKELTISDFDKKIIERAVTIEGGAIKVFPTDTASLTIKYYPSYDALTTTQNPEINSYFHELIVYGILSRAYEDLQEPELSSFYDAKYERELLKRAGSLSNYQEENQTAGEMFTYQKLI